MGRKLIMHIGGKNEVLIDKTILYVCNKNIYLNPNMDSPNTIVFICIYLERKEYIYIYVNNLVTVSFVSFNVCP